MKNEKYNSKSKEQIEKTLKNEMEMGEKLKNEHLVNTLLSTRINDFYFFLMENMEYNSLKSFTDEQINNCSELLCSYFIYQCLLGLFYMHTNLIVHRDIKLENILLNKNYQVKLADFSMSLQMTEDSKYLISRSGTVPYLPPESFIQSNKSFSSNDKNNNNKTNQAHSHKKYLSVCSSLKKDIFAIGVVMYRLMFKEHPFKYEYKMDRETYGKILKKTKLNLENKDVTSDCISFLEGLLKHNVHERFTIQEALSHEWIIKTQKIIYALTKGNKFKNKSNLISLLNDYVYKEDIINLKYDKIMSDFSTKDSEDKEKEKNFIGQKRRRFEQVNTYTFKG
jgi:serine/threonine protein kinase